MVKACCVRGCKNDCYAGCPFSFHGVPKDVNLKKKWEEVVPGNITKWSVVCSAHFRSDDFILGNARNFLSPNAVPSIFPGKNLSNTKSSINCKSQHDQVKVFPKTGNRHIVKAHSHEQLKDNMVQPSQQVNEKTYEVPILDKIKKEDIEDPLADSQMSPDDVEVEDVAHKEVEEDLTKPAPFKRKKVEEVQMTMQHQPPMLHMARMGQPFILTPVEPIVLDWSSKLQAMEPSQRVFAEKAINDVLLQGLSRKLGNGGNSDYKG